MFMPPLRDVEIHQDLPAAAAAIAAAAAEQVVIFLQ